MAGFPTRSTVLGAHMVPLGKKCHFIWSLSSENYLGQRKQVERAFSVVFWLPLKP